MPLLLLLLLLSVALGIGLTILALFVRRPRCRPRAEPRTPGLYQACLLAPSCALYRPGCWVAVRSCNLRAVQSALHLHNPKPCSWLRGLTGQEELFIAPPIKGWVLVMGSGLPDPSDDVDICFRFVLDVSRKLGQVQLFSVSQALYHHAWVKADSGKVLRAYAWAGRTLWQQGARTPAETELDLKCFDYTESAGQDALDQPDAPSTNVEKVPLLAARWSLDPARIDKRLFETAPGIAGEPSRRY